MPNDRSNGLDASLVSISRPTENSENVHREVLQALSFLPLKFKEELASLGVKIILTPTILEALSNLDCDITEELGIDPAQCEEWAKGWPCLYEPPTKKIYIGEKWVGCIGNTITYNVLNRCAFAFQKSKDLAESTELYKAIIDDSSSVPQDFMPSNVSDQGEFFAGICAALLIGDNSKVDGSWSTGMTAVFPRTVAFVRKTLSTYS
jgi:hypothetical protein